MKLVACMTDYNIDIVGKQMTYHKIWIEPELKKPTKWHMRQAKT